MTAFDLERFVTAQAGRYPQILAELRRGRKEGHWMWFVFPQIAGLGRSATAQYYAISSADEARAYLAHPLLGPRLIACAEALLAHRRVPAEAILEPVDALKLRSSATLFEAVAADPAPFAALIHAFFGGDRDGETLRLLKAGAN